VRQLYTTTTNDMALVSERFRQLYELLVNDVDFDVQHPYYYMRLYSLLYNERYAASITALHCIVRTLVMYHGASTRASGALTGQWRFAGHWHAVHPDVWTRWLIARARLVARVLRPWTAALAGGVFLERFVAARIAYFSVAPRLLVPYCSPTGEPVALAFDDVMTATMTNE